MNSAAVEAEAPSCLESVEVGVSTNPDEVGSEESDNPVEAAAAVLNIPDPAVEVATPLFDGQEICFCPASINFFLRPFESISEGL
jgi:hypothetical protein